MTTIQNTLETIFAQMDADFIARQVAWAEERIQAVYAFEKSDECKQLRSERKWEMISRKKLSLAGGKTWYEMLTGRGEAGRKEVVEKYCARVIKARNASITAKLEKAGVTTVDSSDYARTHDGFHGTFVVNTDAGKKIVEIETILAGGYNIQCLHQRTLVKVLNR